MAYDKKYIGEKEVIKEYLDDREDKIGSEFSSLSKIANDNKNKIDKGIMRTSVRYNRKYLGSNDQWYRPVPSEDVPEYGIMTFEYIVQNGSGKPIGWGEAVYTVHNNVTTLFKNETSGSEIKMGVSEGKLPHFHQKLGYDIFIVFTYIIGKE